MNDMTPITSATTAERDAQPCTGQTRIEIFTDGSCIGNPGSGATVSSPCGGALTAPSSRRANTRATRRR